MRPVRSATLLDATPRGVRLDCGGGRTCRISVLGPGLVRVLFLSHGAARLDRTWTVPAHGAADVPWEGRDRLDEDAWPVPDWALAHGDGTVILTTPALRLDVTLAPFGLAWRLPDGTVFARDRPAQAYEFGEVRPRLAHHMARDVRDRYYGLGDKTGPLDLHGRRLRVMGLDSLSYDPRTGDPLYKHWPFLITRDGATGVAYGTYYDNGATAAFDLGAAHDNYYGPFRSYEAEDGDLDYYVFLGPRLRDVTPAFLQLTGRTALPPRWTLGYAQTTMALADEPQAQAAIQAFIDRCKAEDVPISAFHFGSGYTSIGPKRYVFHWNRAKFPDAPGLMRRFHEAGMHVVANLKPCLLDDHPAYAAARDLFVQDGEGPAVTQFWDGQGAHLDFTNPAAIRWWQDGVRDQILQSGIDAGWNDNNEYGLWDERARCDGFGHPVPLELMRPVQALLMTRATLEQQRASQPGLRPFTITRAGCPGIQRYAQTWSGDNTTSWDTLRWNLRTGLGMSLSGMLNTGHDVGGFAGPAPDAELLVRWAQAGLLHPRFIMNSWKPDGVFNSPWLHETALPAIRDAIRLRYRLMPYLYSLLHAAVDQGTPMIQPTFLQFDDDPRCFEDCDELMLGPFLLAAPVVTPGERERRAYLPKGPEAWFDFHSGTPHAPGTEAVLDAPLDRLPLLAAAGAIIPMTEASGDFSLLHDELSRHVRVFPGPAEGSSRFVLMEDDGVTEAGARTEVTLTLSWTPQEASLRAEAAGGYSLPYDRLTVASPEHDARPLILYGPLLAAERVG